MAKVETVETVTLRMVALWARRGSACLACLPTVRTKGAGPVVSGRRAGRPG